MWKQLIIVLTLLLCYSVAAKKDISVKSAAVQDDIELLQPHIITIERLENLLRRAGEIFHTDIQEPAPEREPPEHMQSPSEQPYNFYLPLFDYEDEGKLNAKSRKMEIFAAPPLVPRQDQYNHYAQKPKKLPKKFNVASKQVNFKWLNSYEKAQAIEVPKSVYLEQDERNRINFDDSFFAVDMQLKIPDNLFHKDRNSKELLKRNGEMAEEDLMASPAILVPQFSFNYRSTKRGY